MRRCGTVVKCERLAIFILEDGEAAVAGIEHLWFVSRSRLRDGLLLSPGDRVSFIPTSYTPRPNPVADDPIPLHVNIGLMNSRVRVRQRGTVVKCSIKSVYILPDDDPGMNLWVVSRSRFKSHAVDVAVGDRVSFLPAFKEGKPYSVADDPFVHSPLRKKDEEEYTLRRCSLCPDNFFFSTFEWEAHLHSEAHVVSVILNEAPASVTIEGVTDGACSKSCFWFTKERCVVMPPPVRE